MHIYMYNICKVVSSFIIFMLFHSNAGIHLFFLMAVLSALWLPVLSWMTCFLRLSLCC